jgi:hypothetical protein
MKRGAAGAQLTAECVPGPHACSEPADRVGVHPAGEPGQAAGGANRVTYRCRGAPAAKLFYQVPDATP